MIEKKRDREMRKMMGEKRKHEEAIETSAPGTGVDKCKG